MTLAISGSGGGKLEDLPLSLSTWTWAWTWKSLGEGKGFPVPAVCANRCRWWTHVFHVEWRGVHGYPSQPSKSICMWRDESLRGNRAQWSVLNQLILDLVCWSSVADASLCLLSIASRCDIDKIVELPPAACRSSASALSSHSGSVTPHAHAHWFSPGPCLHSADPIASIRHPHLGPAPELISSSPSRPHLVRGLVVSTLS